MLKRIMGYLVSILLAVVMESIEEVKNQVHEELEGVLGELKSVNEHVQEDMEQTKKARDLTVGGIQALTHSLDAVIQMRVEEHQDRCRNYRGK